MGFLETYRPCEALQDVVALYWRSRCDLEQALVQEMYTPTLQALTFNLGGRYEDILLEEEWMRMDKYCYVIGQPLSKRVSLSNPKGIDILGVKFTPLGLYLLTGIDMRHISDKIIDAGDIWALDIPLLYEEILSKGTTLEQIGVIEHFLIRKRKQHSRCEKAHMVRHTLELMAHKRIFSVSQLREDNFVTKKTFERYFLNHIGVTPKQYANICRFNNVRAYLDSSLSEPDWHEVVVSFGYYDQSHLIRDFKRYAGKTPKEYFSLIPHAVHPKVVGGLKQILT
ncbi:helix-turn-helix domain-containing protein [Chitinophaga alhagiae]|uniref:helix-turn-helix domain-containing protein n=1 Tax=Chitinophaga alhagiae TaxID=2203219 RepID=UPI000E5AC90D|nr:helix-turn-helix domain-containing protein [Chitinophaga alhagiae]